MEKNKQKSATLARLNKMKYYVRRFGIIKAGEKFLLPTLTAMALNISNVQAQEHPEKTNAAVKDNIETSAFDFSETDNSNLLAYRSKVCFNINAEVDKRADWFISNFLEAAKKHLDRITHCGNKKAYVKKNFFDVVSPVRNLSGSTPYCITALNRALIDANNLGGDLNYVLPNPHSSECYAANECNAFAEFLQKKGYGDCIESGAINYNKLTPGDIILTVRNHRGNRHARQYLGKIKGKHYCLNFNIDGIREFTNTSGIVIHMKKLTHKAILLNLEREKLIASHEEQFDTIIPMEQARKIQDYLAKGRKDQNYQNSIPENFFAGADLLPAAPETTFDSPKKSNVQVAAIVDKRRKQCEKES